MRMTLNRSSGHGYIHSQTANLLRRSISKMAWEVQYVFNQTDPFSWSRPECGMKKCTIVDSHSGYSSIFFQSSPFQVPAREHVQVTGPVHSNFSGRPASWPWCCNPGSWSDVTTGCLQFTAEPALWMLQARVDFIPPHNTSWLKYD